MMNNRSLEIDLLKGFGIFLMVFDHVGWGMLVHTYIQSFHMPLFFIVSGFLWKEGQTTKEVSLKKSKVALKPYVFFALSYYKFGFTIDLIIPLTFISMMMIIIVSDYKYMIIPDIILIIF